MTRARRVLPCGWLDLGRQLLIWFAFLVGYELARGLADRNPARAFWNGWRVLTFERRVTHHLVELSAQRAVEASHPVLTAAAWTYWHSEFTVLGLALLWVYLRRHDQFTRFRNAVLLANVVGLVGFVLWPTAPPRFFTSFGFEDTLDRIGSVNHGSGIVSLAANPYAAMPSLHAADALIVAVVMVAVCRHRGSKALWAIWPLWVWFCLIATANHSVLDVIAGVAVGATALLVVALVRVGFPRCDSPQAALPTR